MAAAVASITSTLIMDVIVLLGVGFSVQVNADLSIDETKLSVHALPRRQ
mgnify:CR=1 FL=1